MPELPQNLVQLATRYYERLAGRELVQRLGHHLAHVAPKGWLSLELAWLYNRVVAQHQKCCFWCKMQA